jgi:mono/diheme cytochrome c family protein
MRRWGKLLAFAIVVVAAGRAYGRLPEPKTVRAVKPPAPVTAEARGRVVYERYGCTMCHGGDGQGGFANPNAETDGKVPAIIFVKEGYTPAELARLIRGGTPRIGRADPKGQAPPYRMPSWGDRMSAHEVDDLVQYLLSLYPKTAGEKWR